MSGSQRWCRYWRRHRQNRMHLHQMLRRTNTLMVNSRQCITFITETVLTSILFIYSNSYVFNHIICYPQYFIISLLYFSFYVGYFHVAYHIIILVLMNYQWQRTFHFLKTWILRWPVFLFLSIHVFILSICSTLEIYLFKIFSMHPSFFSRYTFLHFHCNNDAIHNIEIY